MRIAWITPIARRSAIGRMGVAVCDELARRGHDILIVRSESPAAIGAEPLATAHRVTIPADYPLARARAERDAIFVNLGDNFDFHGGAFAYLGQPETIGIFHDFYAFNLFNGWRHQLDLTPRQAVGAVVRCYGNQARPVAEAAIEGRVGMAEIASGMPMTEWLAGMCAGAIAHSGFYLPRLRESCGGIVATARLPWSAPQVAPVRSHDGELSIVTVGVVNENKCVDLVIEAIGASETLRSRVRYDVAGPVEDSMRNRLETAAARANVKFVAHGSVSDAELAAIVGASDIMCCLRRPVLEGASASAIEAMQSGRPIIVADVGFYGEIPDEFVSKVPADFTAADVTLALERLAGSSARRMSMGAAAAKWARETFSVAAYADTLEDVAERQIAATPYLRLADRIAGRLARIGLPPHDVAVARMAQAVSSMRGAE